MGKTYNIPIEAKRYNVPEKTIRTYMDYLKTTMKARGETPPIIKTGIEAKIKKWLSSKEL